MRLFVQFSPLQTFLCTAVRLNTRTPQHWSIPPDHPKLAPLVVWVEQNTRALCWWSSPEEHLRPRWEKGWEDWSERREVGTKGHVGHHRLGGGHHHHPYMDKGHLVIATIITLIKKGHLDILDVRDVWGALVGVHTATHLVYYLVSFVFLKFRISTNFPKWEGKCCCKEQQQIN